MFDKFQANVDCFLGYETELVVRFLIYEILECLLLVEYAGHIEVNGAIDFVVCNSTFYYVVLGILFTSFAAITYKVKPFLIISSE